MSGPGMTEDVEIRVGRDERLTLEVQAPFAERPWTLAQPIVGR